MIDPVQTVLTALDRGGFDPRPAGLNQWESRCPVHEGSRRNLSIRRGDDGRALLHCHHTHESGGGTCDFKDIAAALGLAESDLFASAPLPPNPPGKGRRRKAALFRSARDAAGFLAGKLGSASAKAWLYRQADGSEAFVVYRFDTPSGKTYRPVHKAPEGWRIGDPPGPLPLYNLPEVIDAPRVFLNEGEKASEVARRLGVVPTTSAHGAEAAAKTDWTPLAGKEVILLPDNDVPGEGYVRAVLGLLADLEPKPTVRVVRLPGLPEGGDIAEWSESLPDSWGPDEARAELERLADASPVEELCARSPDAESPASPRPHFPRLEPGTWVKALDRDNFGRVVDDLGTRARVHFVSPSGQEATVTLHKAELIRKDERPLDAGEGDVKDGAEVQVTRLCDVQVTDLEWLWPNVYPLGKITLLAGDPGLGKTFIALDIIARLTRGAAFPHSEPPTAPGSAVLLSAEDDLADTLVPRLIAADADLGRVVTFRVRLDKDTFGLPTLASIRELETVLDGLENPRLVVIDPVSAFVGSINDHRNAELRGLLAPLAELAARRRVAIVMVTHLSKGAGGKALYRATGSLAYAAAARACWLVAKDPEDGGRRLFLPFKCNLSIEPKGLTYSLVDGRVAWGESTTVDADSALSSEGGKTSSPSQVERAAEWLPQALAGGPRPSEEVIEEGRTLFGFKRDTLFKAKDRLGVKARKTGFDGGWVWELPPEASKRRSVEASEAVEMVPDWGAIVPFPTRESVGPAESDPSTVRPFDASGNGRPSDDGV